MTSYGHREPREMARAERPVNPFMSLLKMGEG
jgi:hypothetical protein